MMRSAWEDLDAARHLWGMRLLQPIAVSGNPREAGKSGMA